MRYDSSVKSNPENQAKAGRFVWRAPLGYTNGRTRREPSLLIDRSRADLIKRFFEAVATGKRVSDALADVNALGLRTLENRPVTPWTAKKWLDNVVYCGYVRSDEWGLLVKGDFEPIIDEELFTRVRDVLTGRALPFIAHQRSNPVYPLKGVVMCPSCGKPVTASASKSENGNRFPYYHCHRGRGHFRQSAATVEASFLELLDSLQPEPRREQLISTVFRRVWDEKESYVVRDREMMQAELKKLEAKKKRLIEDRAAGVLDIEDIAEPLREVKEQIDSIKFRLTSAMHSSIDVDTAINYLLHTLWNSRNLWEVMDLEARQRLAKLIFPAGIMPSDSGFGTPTTSSIFLRLAAGDGQIDHMVRPERFELPT